MIDGVNTVDRHIAATCEEVFAVLADGWMYASWVVGASRIRNVETLWPAQGSKLLHSFGIWPVVINDESLVLESEPPRRLVLRAKGWPLGEATVVIELSTAPGGCHARMSEDATAGPGRLVPHVLRAPAIRARNVEALRRLALIAENRT